MENKIEPEIVSFSSAKEWGNWLVQNHTKHEGIWMRLYKKASGVSSVNYAEALDEALCYGWIDGQKKSYDDISWLQRFTPRRAKSIWSKRNQEHVDRLIKAGKMRHSGLKAIESAKADGRWEAAYDSPSNATIPPDFQQALDADSVAKQFFDSLTKANKYSFLFRIQSLKRAETRAQKTKYFVAMLAKGESFHP